jgi:hypothetical protein
LNLMHPRLYVFRVHRYNSSRAKCIKCTYCNLFFSPNKFIFHSHRLPDSKYVQPDAANFNSWRRHMKLSGVPPDDITHAWEDVKAMFNGGTRKRMLSSTPASDVAPSITKQQRNEQRSGKKSGGGGGGGPALPPPPPVAPSRPTDLTPYQPNVSTTKIIFMFPFICDFFQILNNRANFLSKLAKPVK